MTKLKRAKNGRIIFTKEMKKDYTILVPDMLPIHFEIMKYVFLNEGYKMELLRTAKPEIKQLGLRYVHNDTCYPALLVIGQFLDALESGNYDVNKTALMIMQSGGGCRASNYIHLLRKALEKAGYGQIPVISHHEIAVFRHLINSVSITKRGLRAETVIQRLFLIVNIYLSVLDGHSLAGQADHPFDKQLLFIIRIPENHNIKPLGISKFIRQPVPKNLVAHHDCVFH